MARPTRRIIASGIAAWDADVDENFDKITGAPFPMAQYTLAGDLPTASSYDDCLALVGNILYISNGATWEVYTGEADNVPDSTATTATQMAIDFNLLLAELQTAGLMATP